jgi:hypothetical protein
MTNTEVEEKLQECREELDSIKALLTGLGDGALPTPYVRKYAVIRAAGSIESGFKKIIADRVDRDSPAHVRAFIAKKVRNASSNPSLENIERMLSEFDDGWNRRFNEKMALADKPVLKEALTKLVKARNSFAHGGGSELPIDDVIEHFDHGRTVLKMLDGAVQDEID